LMPQPLSFLFLSEAQKSNAGLMAHSYLRAMTGWMRVALAAGMRLATMAATSMTAERRM
jgi:hypothetical protein